GLKGKSEPRRHQNLLRSHGTARNITRALRPLFEIATGPARHQRQRATPTSEISMHGAHSVDERFNHTLRALIDRGFFTADDQRKHEKRAKAKNVTKPTHERPPG